MSKNLTRKGLALGAIVALGSTLFAGAPAFAGIESAKVTLAPSAGTTYTTLIGASFELANEVDATIENDGLENKDVEDLTYLITNASLQSLKIDLDGANSNATYGGNLKGMSGDTADLASYEAASDVYVSAKKVIAVTGANLQSADTADVAKNLINIYSSTDSTDAFSVTVQAFLDDNNNGEIDTFEYASAVRTVNFIKASTATVTTAVTSAVVGSSTLQGTVVIGNDVNNKSLVGQISIGFFKNGSVFKMRGATSATTVDTVDLSWDTTDILKNTQYTTIASQDTRDTLATATYTAKAYFGVARSLLGVESAGVSVALGTNASADHTDYLVVTPGANTIRTDADSTTVRTGTTSAIVLNTRVLETTDNSTNSSPWEAASGLVKVAGLKVKVTLSKGATFTAGHEVTAGGKTLTSTSGAVEFETTTDKDGKVAISVTSNKGTKDDVYRVLTQVLTETGYQAGDYTDVTFADASIGDIIIKEEIGSSAVLQIAKGGTLPLNFEVRDNFGALSAVAGTYRVNVATNGTSNTGNPAVSGGKASFSLVDETIASTGSYTITAKVQKLNSAGTAYDDVANITDSVVVHVGVAATAGLTVPADATTGVTLESADFVNHDLRLDANSKTYTSVAFAGTAFVVSGIATTATGAAAPGALVTISSPGAQLVAANGSTSDALLATETISVRASASGAYSVDLRSHVAGDVKISVTSGSATKTVTAKFAWPSSANKDSKLAISGVSSTKAGRSNSFVVTLTDKWGNVVKKTGGETIAIEQTGAGYLVSTPVIVGATTGKAILNLITQPADAGLSNITATFDVTSPDADIVASKDVLVGISATISKAATSKATVKNASGLDVKVVRGTKSVTKVATSDKYAVSLKGGTGSVKVYVENILVATKK